MNINENLKNEVKSQKHKHISASKYHQTTSFANFLSSVIQFDKFFHTVVLYENYLICIFMNIKVSEFLHSESLSFAQASQHQLRYYFYTAHRLYLHTKQNAVCLGFFIVLTLVSGSISFLFVHRIQIFSWKFYFDQYQLFL